MSASIALSSITLANDGITLTGTLSGGTGTGYSPASGVTSYAITVGGVARNLCSSTVSSTTWTGKAYTPIKSGVTVTVVATTGNLVDSGVNTPIATSNAVTNNSTKGTSDEAAALCNIPATTLDAWQTARNGAASALVEAVVIGDSTTSDSGANYSWVYEVAALAVADAYTYGGRGLLEVGDTATRSGPTENLNCIVSQTGFAEVGFFFSLFASFASSVADDTVTLQFKGTKFRLFYDKQTLQGIFTYAVDGGTAVEVSATANGQDTGVVYVSGLSGTGTTTHTIAVTNLGYGHIPAPDDGTGGSLGNNSGTPGFAEGSTQYYKITALDGSSRESTPGPEFSITLDGIGFQNLGFHFTNTGGASYNIYRSATSGGTFQLIANQVAAGGTFTFFNPDDNSATPGVTPPVTDTTQNTVKNRCQFTVDAMRPVGIVWHKNAVSGASYGSYGLSGTQGGDYFNFPYQVALGLSHEAGVDTGWTPLGGPTNRAPTLAICALGINDQQSGQTYTSAIQDAAARFVTAATTAGAVPITVIPHYSRSGSPTTAKEFIDGQKAAAVAATQPWFDFNVALDLAGYGLGGPHLDQTGYNYEAASIWTNLLSLSGTDTTPPTVTSATPSNDGLSTVLLFSETVTVGDQNEFTLSSSVGTVTFSTASDGGATWTLGNSRVIYKAETLTLNFSGTQTVDLSDNQLATISGGTVTNGSTVICAVPTNLGVTPGNTINIISWTANTEPVIGSYKIYHSTTVNGTYTLLATVNAPGTSYTHTGLTNGDSAHFYKITSLDSASNESAKSSAVQGTPAAATAGSGCASFAFAGFGFGFDGD